jgi:hypothetical protein
MPESTPIRPPALAVRFMPWFRNNGQRPGNPSDHDVHFARNRADRRAARSHVTVLAAQHRNGTRPRTSPRMRHGLDDRPRIDTVLRQARRAGLTPAQCDALRYSLGYGWGSR